MNRIAQHNRIIRSTEGKLGGVGGAQSASLPSTCKGAPTTHIARRADIHPDALPPGSEGASPSRPCEPMVGTTISMCFSFRSNCLCAVTGGRGSYKSLRNRYVRLYMNAVESSILFLLDFVTICGVAQSEWNSQTWSLIDHRSVYTNTDCATIEKKTTPALG